ncbi:MAG: Ig-like domain-containing protein [Planctomycetota bacterium]
MLRSNYFQLNGTNGPTGTDAILAATTDQLFVGVNNYYLADGSAAIDSSSNTLADRLNFVTFRTELGISQSNIVAPDRDVFGQLRVDSDGAGSGGGSDVFRDRGAVDEADTDSPYVILLDPLDNDIAGVDADPNETVVLLNDPVSEAFLLLIGDGRGPNAPFEGTGIDASTVSEQTIRVRRNNVELTEGVDYIRGFNESTGELRLTPLTTLWQPGSVYEISLDNTVIADRAGNQLRPNRPDGSTAFTIILPTVLIDFGDAVRAGATTYSTLLADDGARHALINGGEVRLGGIVDEESDSRLAVGGEDDDRVAVTVNHISAGTFAVSAVDDVTSIEVTATPTVGDLLLVNVGEGTVTFEFIATGTAASPGNRGFVFDPAESIDTIAARLTDVLTSTFADFGGGLVLTLVPGAGVASPVITLTNLDDEDGLDIGVYNDGTVDRYVTLSTGNQATTTEVDDVLGYLNPLDDRGANYVLHSNSVGFVDAWIDFNGNGIFEPDSETILDSVAVTPGANTFNVITPAGATDKVTWARFRISPEGGATPSGLVVGGEVEDYQISIINVAPVLPADDEYEVDEDGELDSASLVANPSVLDNDAKDLAQFTTLETIVVDDPLFGELELYANGEFLYSPDNDFAGIDTFTYRVVDQDTGEAGPMFDDQGNPINIGTVTINVQPVNDLPSTSDVTLTAIEDTQRIIDKDELIGLSLADGIPSFTWIDPNDTSVPPVVQTAPWDESLQVLEIISLETAADGLITSATGVGPYTTPRGQFLAFWDGVNLDRIEYTPDQDLNQDHGKVNATDADIFDSFQFTVQDDGRLVNPGADFTIPDDDTERLGTVLAATATALIDVKPIDDIAVGADDLISENNAQWMAFPGSTTPTEDTTLTIPQAYLLDNDVVARATAEDETGGINDAGVRVADVSPTSAEGGTVSIVGTDIIYSPADNQYGIDTFTYTLVDTGISFNPATGSDEADDTDSVTVTVSILVKPINDAPQADPLTLELIEFRESFNHLPNANPNGIGRREFNAQTLLRLNEPGSALEVSPPNEFPAEFNESEQELRVVQIGSSVGGLSIDARTLTYDPATGQAPEQTLETPDGELRLQFALVMDPNNVGAFLPGTGHLVTGVYEPDTDYNETVAGNPTDEFTFVVQDFGEITVPGAASFPGESTTTDNHGLLTSEPATVTLITRQTNDEPVLPNPPLVTFEEDHAGGVALFYDIYNSTFVDSDDPAVHGLSPVILVGPETADDEELREQVTVTLSDVTTSAPAGMFAVDPVLDQYGVLSFTAAPNAFGYAVFTITATDDGLSYAENTDAVEPDPLSVTRQLTIHITPVNDRPVTGDRQLTVDEVEEFTDGTGDPTPDQAVLLLNPDQFLNGQVAGEEAEQSDFTDDMTLVDQFDEEDQMLRVVQFTVEDMDGNSVVVDAENNNGTPIDLATGTIVFNFDDNTNGGAFTGGDFRPYVDRNDRTPFDPTDEQFTYVVEDFGLADIPGFSRTDPDSASEEDYTSAIPDENRSLPGNVTITIRQVNDAPVFPELGTISFPEDVNPDGDPVFIDVYTNTLLPTNDRAVHNLPQDIFVADPNTALDELERQTLVFSYSPLATSAPEGMFTADPILDEYGVLTLMPAPDAFGYAVFEITATDNGVDASGANDPRSITRTLTVHITPVNDRPVTEDRQLTVAEVEELMDGTGDPTGDEAVLLLNPDQFLTGQVAGTEAEPSDIPTDDPAVAPFAESDQMLRVVRFNVVDSSGSAVLVDVNNNNGTTINLATGTAVFNFDDASSGGAFTGGEFRPYVDRNDRTPFDPTDEQFTYVVQDFGASAIPGFSLTDPVAAMEEDYTATTGVNESVPRTMTITTTQVNDAPVFPELDTISFPEDVNPDGDPVFVDVYSNTLLASNDPTVHNLPLGIFVADPNTALDEIERQTLAFSYSSLATSAPAGMFTADPVLDEYGVLTLMPAPDAFGYAVFEVTATDDGVDTTGAADPRSSTRTLTVHITPVNDAPVTEDRQLTVEEVQEFAEITGAPTNDVAALPLNVSDFLTGPVADEDAEPSDFTDGVTVIDEFDEEDQSLRVVEFTVIDSDGNPLVVDASNQNGTIINLVTGTVVFNFDDPAAGGAFTGGEYRPYVDVNNRTPFDPTEEITYIVEDFYQDPDNDVTIPGSTLIDPADVNDDDYTSSTGVNRSASQTLTITTLQVNDIPEIVLNSDIIEILERDDEVGTVIDDFASLVAPGRATALDELVRQGVSFSFARYESLSVAGLFHRDPEVTPEGELTVFPSIDAVGTGVVVVTATDANPSDASFVPRSVEVTFTVHVRPINDAPRLNDVNVPTSITSPNGDTDDQYEVLDNGTLVVTMREDNTADDGTTDDAYVLEARRGVGGDRPGLLDLFTPGPENEADGTLGGSQTLEITSFSPTTALGGTVAAVRDSNNRIIQLLYTPPTNSNRDIVQIDSLTYTVQDDGTDYDLPTASEIPVADPSASLEPAELSTTGRVRFILNPVNDRPEFSIRRPSVDVPEDSGPYTEGSFVANIFAGPRSGDPNTFATDELSSQLIDRFEVRPVSVASPEDPTNPTPLTPALYAAAFPGSGVVTVALNGELSFEAAANVYGIFEFDIVAIDNGADPSAGRGDLNESLPRRLTINIANVNDPPFLVGSDTLMTTTIEDAIGTDAITIPTTGPGSMLENFRAGPSAPAAGLPDENTSGALQLVNVPARSDRGGFVTPELSAGQIVGYRYEPAPNFAGTDTFTYSVTDGDPANLTTGTVMIDVTPVNDGPDIAVANNNLSVSEDPPSPVVISDWLTTALPGPAGDTGGVGRASDEIDGLNAIPAQTIDSYVFEFLSGDTGLLVTSDPVNDPGFRIIGNDLQFTVTPDANGTAVYQVVAIDDGPTTGDNVNVSDPITFVLSVGEVNDPPFFTPGPSPIIVEEDFVVPGGLDRAYDEPWATGISPGAEDERDTQTVQFNIDVAVEDQDKFDVLPAIDGVTGNLSFRLAPDAEGPVIVVVTPQDVIAGTPGIEGQPFELRIEITPQDDAPRPTDDQFESDEDVTLRFTTADLLSNDVDPDTGDALVFVSLQTTTTLGATVTVNSEGEISYNPQTSDALQALIDFAQYDPDDPTQLLSNFQRIDTFTYQVTDTDGEVAIPEAVVTLTINGVNDAPTVHDKSIAIADSGLTTFNVFTGDDNDTDDFDVDGAINPASFVITREPQFGDLSDDNEDGTLTYLPGPDFAGEDFFEYTVADDLGQDSQAARFTLFGRPIPNGQVQGGTSVGRAGEIDVTDSFTSPFPLDLSTLTIVTQPENGTATVNDGLIVYTPDPGYTGDDFLVFRVADINGNFTDDIRMDLTTVSSRLQNPIDPSDVNRNGEVTALDALLVVNRLNAAGGIGQIPVTDDDFGIGTNNGVDEQFYYDQSGDGFISALDALRVINTINEQDLLPVSEPLFSASGSPLTTDEQLAGTIAASPAEEPNSVDELASKVVGTAGTSDATLATIALDQVEQGAGQESDAEAANLDQAIQQLF